MYLFAPEASERNRSPFRRLLFGLSMVSLLLLVSTGRGGAASWTALTNLAPGNTGVMLQMTDGSVMVQSADDLQTWFRLIPDSTGSYLHGTWSSTAPMGFARLYFGSQVLPSGKVWVLGGEYTGVNANGTFANWSNTGEIYDPIANTWTPIAPYPGQTGCPQLNNVTGNVTSGTNIVTSVYPQTAGLVGKTIVGTGIPAGTTVTSVDSASQIHISNNATATVTTDFLSFTTNYRLSACFGDDPSMLLAGGSAGHILAGDLIKTNTFLFDVGSNSWAASGSKVYGGEASDEEGWVKMADGSVLTYDLFKSIATGGSYAEKYNPLTGTWAAISPSDGTALGTIPLLSSVALGDELGPLLRLQDGRALVVGANQHMGLYTPSTNTWAAGPDIIGSLNGTPAPFGADDAPAAILPNGHVIIAADAGPSPVTSTGHTTSGSPVITNIPSTAVFQPNWSVSGTGIPSGAYIISIDSTSQVTIDINATATGTPTLTFGGIFSNPTQLFDFNPAANTVTALAPALADGNLPFLPAFVTRMLVLPTGQMLFTDSTNQLYLYTADGTPSPALRPVINGVTYTGGGNFTLTGKQLNGQSAGAAYGDDVQSDSNYPIVRLVNGSGAVFYARTTNWSNFGVATGTTPQTVNFTLSSSLVTPGSYSVIVSGAGISSFAVFVNITQGEINKQ